MAKANYIHRQPSVNLELSTEEAQTLRDILSWVSGSPISTARKHADAIRYALSGLGFVYQQGNIKGTLTFTKETT